MSKCENMTIGIAHYAKLTNENAERYAVLKVCKGYLEEMGLQDSITFKMIYEMICAALAPSASGDTESMSVEQVAIYTENYGEKNNGLN